MIESRIKSWIYQDLLEKPQTEVLYCKTAQGGLGLSNVKYKMLAHLLTTFLQMVLNNQFKQKHHHLIKLQIYSFNLRCFTKIWHLPVRNFAILYSVPPFSGAPKYIMAKTTPNAKIDITGSI